MDSGARPRPRLAQEASGLVERHAESLGTSVSSFEEGAEAEGGSWADDEGRAEVETSTHMLRDECIRWADPGRSDFFQDME